VSLILGSRIFLVSTTIFHSSLVYPSSTKNIDVRNHLEYGLICRDHDTLDPRLFVQRLERDDELRV
jgi:hypothetical protein